MSIPSSGMTTNKFLQFANGCTSTGSVAFVEGSGCDELMVVVDTNLSLFVFRPAQRLMTKMYLVPCKSTTS